MRPSAIKSTGPLVYIASSGRSGSTLLDLLLNQHSQITGAGEVHILNRASVTNEYLCSCGKKILDCPFWLEVQRNAATELGLPPNTNLLGKLNMILEPLDVNRCAALFQKGSLLLGSRRLHQLLARLFFKNHMNAIQNSMFWYEMIRRTANTPIIIDSSKDPRRLKELYLAEPNNFKLLYLTRDGRAVAASSIRRLNISMKEAATNWKKINHQLIWVQKSIPPKNRTMISYEDLCRNPIHTLKKVCNFLGVTFEPTMTTMSKETCHYIAGNPMLHRKQENTIKLDERWKNQLDEQEINDFNTIAGKMNRSFGYAA